MTVAYLNDLGTTAAPTLVQSDNTEASGVMFIPGDELWIWRNKDALLSVLRGRVQAARGKLIDRGSFARHADIQLADDE